MITGPCIKLVFINNPLITGASALSGQSIIIKYVKTLPDGSKFHVAVFEFCFNHSNVWRKPNSAFVA